MSYNGEPRARRPRASAFHWMGVAMLGISAILLFVVSISAPIIHDIGFLKVKLSNHTTAHHSSVTFGSFGHCVLDVPHIASPSSSSAAVSSATPLQKRKVSRVRNSGEDKCSHRKVGYSPGQIMENITQTHFGKASAKGIKGATHLFVLHPIAFAITLIAFASSCTTGAAGSIAGSLFAFFAWFLTLFLIIVDAIVFAIVKHAINKEHSGAKASFSSGWWLCLAAAFSLFFGMFIVLFTSFSRRRASKKQKVPFSSRGGHPSWLERFLHGSSSQRGNGQTPTNGGVQSYGEQGYGGGQSDRESQSYGGGQNYQ